MAKILCVEDEIDLREDIAEELELAGHTVLQAADGREGLDLIVDQQPDLVISDITMPRMDGYALLEEVRSKHPKLDQMPFIFLSALADQCEVVKGLTLGGDDYLTKPIDFELLLGKVTAELRRAGRIQKKMLEDYVRLYKALAPEKGKAASAVPKPAATRMRPVLTVSLVGRPSGAMWQVQKVLESGGHAVTAYTSGRMYLEQGLRPPPHAVFLWPETTDLSAADIAPRISAHRCLRVLVGEADVDGKPVPVSAVDIRMSLPLPRVALLKLVYKHGAEKFAKAEGRETAFA